MKIIDTWLIVLGAGNIILLVLAMFLLLPKNTLKHDLNYYLTSIQQQLVYLLIIFTIVAIHLIEINILDDYFTILIGSDFAPTIEGIENGIVAQFSTYWIPPLVILFVFIYIILYPFTLWFTPLYALVTNQKDILKTLAFGLGIIYIIALPFYLFLPITNVYLYYQLPSPLEQTIPTIEQFFYTTTSTNNTFPSLHVAMSLLIAYVVTKTENKRLQYLTKFIALTVIIAVIYLAIHWLVDVIGGIILTLTAIKIVPYFNQENKLWNKTKSRWNKKS